MGGDCLNYGCVPSKALIAAAKAAQAQRSGAAFGIAPVEPRVDFGRGHGSRARRDRRHRAERFGRALREAGRARAEGGGALRRPHASCRPAPHRITSKPHRAGHRLAADGAADPRPRRRALSHQRDGLRQPHAARPSDRDRRRADRPRNGAGAPPARRQRSRCWKRPTSSPRTIPSSPPSSWRASAPKASTCARRVKIARVERTAAGIAVILATAASDIDGSHLLVAAGRAPIIEELDLDDGRHRPHHARHHGRCLAAHLQPQRLGDRRLQRPLRLHPHGGLRGLAVHPRRAVPRCRRGSIPRSCRGRPTPIPSWPRSA